jgi:hypothetical protein
MKKIISLIAIGLLVQACYKDRGNYIYDDINEIIIEGIGNHYESEDGIFTIRPKLTTSMDAEAHLIFEWISIDVTNRTFATTRTLENVQIGLGPGLHACVFRVIDTISQKRFEHRFTLRIAEITAMGYLVMQEDANGYLRLDMLGWLNQWYRHLPDVLTTFESDLPPQRGPRKLSLLAKQLEMLGGTSIYVLTETGTNRIDPLNFSTTPQRDIRYAFLSPEFCPPDFIANNIVRRDGATGSAVMHGQDGIYVFNSASNVFFSRKINTIDGVNFFTPSPKIAVSGQHAIVFDDDRKSFYLLQTNLARISRINPTLETLTKFENTEQDLVFLGSNNRYAGNDTDLFFFAILKDSNDDFWFLRMLAPNLLSASRQPEQDMYKKMNATDIDQATLFAVGGEFAQRQLYYAVGGKIYQYNFNDNQSFEVLNLPNQTITYLGFDGNVRHGATGSSMIDAEKNLTVGSFNETTRVGTLAFYEIPDLRAPLRVYADQQTGRLKTFTGFARIVDVLNKNH